MTREQITRMQEAAFDDKLVNKKTIEILKSDYKQLAMSESDVPVTSQEIQIAVLATSIMVEIQNCKALLCEIALRLPEPPKEHIPSADYPGDY